MEPIKAFNNVVIGQFALTRIPVKVYVGSRYLTITSTDDVQDPFIGFGMDENGQMHRYDYRTIEHLLVSGNVVDLDTYNKAMGADTGEEEEEGGEEEDEGGEEEEEEEPKKEESVSLSEMARSLNEKPIEYSDIETYGDLKQLIDIIQSDEKDAKVGKVVVGALLSAVPYLDAAKTVFDLAKAAYGKPDSKKTNTFIDKLDVDDEVSAIVDDTVEDNFLAFIAKDMESKPDDAVIPKDFSMNDELQQYLEKEFKQRTVAGYQESVNEMHQGYTFGTGDIVKNVNPDCEHFGSIGVVKKIIDLPNGMGTVAVYTVGNSGSTYKPGMSLTKTLDQLEKI